jgi:TonB family protein
MQDRDCGVAAGIVALLLAANAAGAEPAAAPSPTVQHYQAYARALEQGNLPLAETEADSALAASVAQYGDGGRTAVLASNLAGVRLLLGRYSAAVEPARKALAIAESQGDASGVDVHVARLMLGRAEMPGGGAAAMDRLLQAVKAAQGVPGIDAEAYPAAVELATAAHDAGRYQLSSEAWVASARFAKGSRINADYARARAKLGEAVARTVPIMKSQAAGFDRRAAGFGRRIREFEAIDALLAEAMDLVHDQAVQGEIGGELTRAQAVYGEAAALKNGLNAKLKVDQTGQWKETTPTKQANEIGVKEDSPPRCARRWVTKPEPAYPPARLVAGGVGSVLLKILVDEAGTVSRVQVAGAAGGQEFSDSVVAAAGRWRAEKEDGATPGCRMAGESFLPVKFVFSS